MISVSLVLIAAALSVNSAPAPDGSAGPRYHHNPNTPDGSFSDKMDVFMDQQYRSSVVQMLQNINPANTIEGTVVAGQSKENPNYFFHSVQDAALTMTQVVRLYSNAADVKDIVNMRKYEGLLWNYVSRENANRKASSLSEPRFGVVRIFLPFLIYLFPHFHNLILINQTHLLGWLLIHRRLV
jgi:hypothetical protein